MIEAPVTAEELLALTPLELADLDWRLSWLATARKNQLPPVAGPDGEPWTQWGVRAGRGFGKTRVGAEWLGRATFDDPQALPSAVIAPTLNDVRFTCFEGPAGLLNVIPPEHVKHYASNDRVLILSNGATIRGFGSDAYERLRGPQHARVWCFVSGTAVATPSGSRGVETLRPGDLVLTRKGPRRVLVSSKRKAPVGVVSFSNGTHLEGTAEHPVYSNGWTRLDRLRVGDEVCVLSASSGAASAGTATAEATTNAPTRPKNLSALSGCTELSGSRSTARYRRATTSTTSMKTEVTTGSKTSAACLGARTDPTTSQKTRFLDAIGLLFRRSMFRASTAASRCPGRCTPQSQFAGDAVRQKPTPQELSTKLAATAEQVLGPGLELSAASVVSTWQPSGLQYVYCIKVEEEPEYFANGVLVHNCDELAAWLYPRDTWDMMIFGLRLGPLPQVVWTTTPKPLALVRDLSKPQRGRVITLGTTFDNKANLPQSFYDELLKYEGTVIGRQELYGEMIDPEEAGIIRRSWFKLWPNGKPLPDLEWIVMSLDTAFTEETLDRKTGDPDYSACTVWGVFYHENKRNVMLLDCWQDRLGLPDLIERVKKELQYTYGDDQDRALIKPKFGSNKPLLSGRKVELVLIEEKGSGISLRQSLERQDILTHGYNPGRADKLSRLHIVSQVFKNGLIWLPESGKISGQPMSWSDEMVSQLCSFTGARNGGHDDFVDSTTQAIRLFMDKNMLDGVDLTKRPEVVDPPKRRQNPYAR